MQFLEQRPELLGIQHNTSKNITYMGSGMYITFKSFDAGWKTDTLFLLFDGRSTDHCIPRLYLHASS